MDQNYPLLTDRIQSVFIDFILIVVLMFVFAALLDKIENPPDWLRIALFFGIWAIYEPLFVTLGCTVGQYIKGIRVRRYDDPSRRIGLVSSFVRYIVKMLLGWISFLTMSMNKEKRAMHDYASGSVMICTGYVEPDDNDEYPEVTGPAAAPEI
jgi:uncharacterized RDD family membrane protein YckC